MISSLGKRYQIQGETGPVEAKRPSDDVLVQLREISHAERFGIAVALAEAGFTIDAAVDVNGWDYWKTMALRRRQGYTWVPAGNMPNVLIAPGLWMPSETDPNGLSYDAEHPPIGAILIPASVEEDPNYVEPKPVTPPPPPPDGQAVFGEAISVGEFAGCYYVGVNNTVPPASHATRDGEDYVFVALPRGFLGSLRLWMPTGR